MRINSLIDHFFTRLHIFTHCSIINNNLDELRGLSEMEQISVILFTGEAYAKYNYNRKYLVYDTCGEFMESNK